MKTINKIPVVLFTVFLLSEICTILSQHAIIPEILARIAFILAAIVTGIAALFFMTMAVGIALGFIFIAMKSIIQQH
jgi:hypothetical protein